MAKPGKRIAKAYEGIDSNAAPVAVDDAVKLVKSRATAKFDETVEVAMNLNIDPRKQDQNVRGTVMLPHGTGKAVRVGVFARGDKAKEAEAAGADVIGAEDLAEKVQAGEINFDKAGIVHAGVGKASFTEAALVDNVRAFVGAITRAKPTGVKGTYISRVSVSSTMGPGVKVDLTGLADEART
jgi:large subunit ribosomal protein L1